MNEPSPRAAFAAAAVLLVIFFLQGFASSRLKSPTSDEVPHLAAGLAYIEARDFSINPQHPPLMKELAALGASAGGMHWPRVPATGAPLRLATEREIWKTGSDLLAGYGPDRAMRHARLPMLIVATMLGAVLFLWGRQLLGASAALGALFLFALDPNIIAHSYLVTTDAGFAAFTLLSCFALWRYVQKRTVLRLVIAGLCLGLALCAKFSGIALLPVTALLLFAADPEVKLSKRLIGWLPAFAGMLMIAVIVIEVVYLFPHSPAVYLDGLRKVNADRDPNYLYYLAGYFSHHFLTYFSAAYLLKEPIASILLAGLGCVILLRRRQFLRRRQTELLTCLFLIIPPAVLFAGYSIGADDIGIRYIIPVLPFLFLIGGAALGVLFHGPVWQRAIAVVLCLWVAANAIGIYPDHLSYFNESACLAEAPEKTGFDAGSRCGPAWLDDSNVDWGQGLPQLKQWLDAHSAGREFNLMYFGAFPPSGYGITGNAITSVDLKVPPARGLYVISNHAVARLPAFADFMGMIVNPADWMRSTPPVAVVGHAYSIYDLP